MFIKKRYRIVIYVMVVYIILTTFFGMTTKEGFSWYVQTKPSISASFITPELTSGQALFQAFNCTYDTIDSITVDVRMPSHDISDRLTFSIIDPKGTLLTQEIIYTNGRKDGKWEISFTQPVTNVRGSKLILVIHSEFGEPGSSITFTCGDTVSAGKIEISTNDNYPLNYNDEYYLAGTLCFSITGTTYSKIASYYWYFVIIIGIAILVLSIRTTYCYEKKKSTIILKTYDAFRRYNFLVQQLVSRNFKTKYKRSILGILWSVLNPLLTMTVLSLIFSTLFKSNIENFTLYLLCGIICWNLFSECTNMCLNSITSNASLLMKVYVPKYLFPFSTALSSLINFIFSLIPLFAIMFLTNTAFTMSFPLLIYGIICLFVLSLGIGLGLSASMVFFRDTQFLWGVISTLWMYLTPIFYDVSIIPSRILPIYKINPMYHILYFFRSVLINGISPQPSAYIYCFLAASIPFTIGLWFFYKTQDKFILYL